MNSVPPSAPPMPSWMSAVTQIPGVRCLAGARLADFTTFRLGGPCPYLLDCPASDRLPQVLAILRDVGARWRLLGGGSNVLVSDAGVDEIIVRHAADTPDIRQAGTELDVAAATPLDLLAHYCAEQGLDGLIFATGIPGTVGGAIAGNAGAFGEDLGGRLVSLTLLDAHGRIREVAPASCGFAYRQSDIPARGDTVLRARFRFARGNRDALLSERRRILALRRERHPDWRVLPTAGSFFRNVEPTSAAGRRQAAGWFLDRAGARSMREGGVRVFERHANILVKDRPDGTAADAHRLALRMAEAVRQMFGLVLTPEVRRWGAFPEA